MMVTKFETTKTKQTTTRLQQTTKKEKQNTKASIAAVVENENACTKTYQPIGQEAHKSIGLAPSQYA